jgi:hypothetical protein
VRYIGNEKAHTKYLKAAVETGNLGAYLEQEMMKQPELSRMALNGIRRALNQNRRYSRVRGRVPALTVALVGEKLELLPRAMTKWVTTEDGKQSSGKG